MNRSDLLTFMRIHRLAVQASVSPSGGSQSAVVGFAVSDAFEVVFDTLSTTRKIRNLRFNPAISFVIGGLDADDERTVQYEGIADEPRGPELDRLKALYFAEYPDGRERERWPNLIYIRAHPTWIRYSDWNVTPPMTVEFTRERLTTGL